MISSGCSVVGRGSSVSDPVCASAWSSSDLLFASWSCALISCFFLARLFWNQFYNKRPAKSVNGRRQQRHAGRGNRGIVATYIDPSNIHPHLFGETLLHIGAGLVVLLELGF